MRSARCFGSTAWTAAAPRASDAAGSAAPHERQNFLPAPTGCPHAGHASSSLVPHSSQNCAVTSFSDRHRGQRIVYSANCAARQRRAAPRPSFSRISSNFTPTSVRAA